MKSLYGLPCEECGSYYESTLAICPVCHFHKRTSTTIDQIPMDSGVVTNLSHEPQFDDERAQPQANLRSCPLPIPVADFQLQKPHERG